MFFLQDPAHPQRYRIEMRAHADGFAGKIFRSPNTAGAANDDIAVTEFAMGKHRDRTEWRAAPDPAKKHAHLQFAHVEFEIARKTGMALLRRQSNDVQVDPLGLDGAIDQEARSVVFVTGQCQTKFFHNSYSIGACSYCTKCRAKNSIALGHESAAAWGR